MKTRYALYLAPPPESDLWRFGCRVLGRDAASGAAIEGFAPEGFAPPAWREVAAEPRRYGFHATLKAPFRLRAGQTFEELDGRIRGFAEGVAAFDLGSLGVSTLRLGEGDLGFVALTPLCVPAELAALEARAHEELDAFRAPPTEAEIARRRPERFSPRQRDYLATWGYPYVFEEFRLHFTLSGPVRAPETLAPGFAAAFAREVPDPRFAVDALALFEQPDGGEFRLVRRYPLKA